MRKIRRWIGSLTAAAALAGAACGAEKESLPLQVEHSIARDYGYFMGDLVEVSYLIFLPAGQFLNDGAGAPSLSNQAGEPDPASWEVKNRTIQHRPGGQYTAYHLGFIFQVFSAPDGVQSIEIPAIRFNYGPKESPTAYSSNLPAVPVVISSLAPEGAAFKPPILWTWTSPSPRNIRLAGFAVLLAGLLPLFFWERKTFSAYSPFKCAREKISREKDPVAALILFRKALNEKTGKPVFPHNLRDFFQAFPQARAYEREVEEMVRLSDEMIFNPRNTVPREGLTRRLSGLAGKLRKAEKWR